jgi:predicted AAA+ superfamily ATPase
LFVWKSHFYVDKSVVYIKLYDKIYSGGKMKRLIDEQLIQWENKYNRQPLIIDGARQTGKTYAMV